MTKKENGPTGQDGANKSPKQLINNKNYTPTNEEGKVKSAALDAALAYADRGWSVFPIRPKLKAPMTKHGFKDASCYLNKVKEWWGEYPQANIGVATGQVSGLLVVDIDPRNGGEQSFKEFQKLYGPMPHMPTVKTGGDGKHFFLKHPGGNIPGRTNILPGIDIKSDGGYVLAPPSIHPNGKPYVWEVDPDQVELADLPDSFRDVICLPSQNEEALAHPSKGFANLEDLRLPINIAQLIIKGDADNKYASRSEAIFAALRSMVKAGHNDTTIKSILSDPKNGLSEKPIEKGAVWLDGEIERARAKGGNQTILTPRPFSAKTLMAEELAPLIEIVPGIVVSGLTILAGPPKIGKSWLALCLGVDLPRARDAFGNIPVEPTEVLYLALEDGKRRLHGRLNKLLQGIEPPNGLTFEINWPRFGEGGMRHLKAHLEENPELRLIIVDTFIRIRRTGISKGNIYAEDYAAAQEIKALADKYEVGIVVIHHLRKSEASDPIDMVSGSIGMTAAADTILVLKRDRCRADAVLHVMGRDIEEQDLALEFNSQTCQWRILGDADDFRISVERSKILWVLNTMWEHTRRPTSPKDLAFILEKKANAIRQLLGKMAEDGEVKVVKRGLYKAVNNDNNNNDGNNDNTGNNAA